jgi:hypothetical protein
MGRARGINLKTCNDRYVGKDVPRETGIQFIAKRILNRCIPGPNGCLLYTGSRSHKGYGQTSAYGHTRRTHRLVWEAARGPIPKGLIVCHECDTPPCNNIEHMWLGTIKENGVDASEKKRCRMQKRTSCFRGHDLTPDNTYISPNGARHCKACARIACRLRAGWPEHALEIPAQAPGQRPDFQRLRKRAAPKHLGRDGRAANLSIE